jgi:hypothetical protein
MPHHAWQESKLSAFSRDRLEQLERKRERERKMREQQKEQREQKERERRAEERRKEREARREGALPWGPCLGSSHRFPAGTHLCLSACAVPTLSWPWAEHPQGEPTLMGGKARHG